MIRPEGRERLTQLPPMEEIADFTTAYGLWVKLSDRTSGFPSGASLLREDLSHFSVCRRLYFSGICGISRYLLLGSFRFCPRPGRLERTQVPPRSSQNENDTGAMGRLSEAGVQMIYPHCILRLRASNFRWSSFNHGDVVELHCGLLSGSRRS